MGILNLSYTKDFLESATRIQKRRPKPKATEECYIQLWGLQKSRWKINIPYHHHLHCMDCCSVAQSCLTLCSPWIAAHQASLSFAISWSFLRFMSIESMMPPNHLVLCRPLPLLPSIFPSIRVFSNQSALCIRSPKYWSFSFSISPSNECWGLISFRID